MADVQKISLNWIEIDHSIISAINAMQIARDYFNTNSTVIAGRQPRQVILPAPALAKPVTCRHLIRDEQVASCFDDAERMLDEVRARMMIARAILAGAPKIDAGAGPWRPVAAAATRPELLKPSLESLISRWAAAANTIWVVAKRSALEMAGNAADVISRNWGARRRISVSRYVFTSAMHIARECQRHLLVPVLRNIPVRMRRSLWSRSHLLRNANDFEKRSSSATAARPFYARHSTLIHTASAIIAGALTVWMASATTVGSPAAVPPLAANISSTPAVYSSCSVAAWGKACYPRRSQP